MSSGEVVMMMMMATVEGTMNTRAQQISYAVLTTSILSIKLEGWNSFYKFLRGKGTRMKSK